MSIQYQFHMRFTIAVVPMCGIALCSLHCRYDVSGFGRRRQHDARILSDADATQTQQRPVASEQHNKQGETQPTVRDIGAPTHLCMCMSMYVCMYGHMYM